ncbi:MarR family winged helix-turn-helix transcriptional regulator [Agrococcus casei]|uniref:MarR family winged helix-turn-helix transcriptional regulator n=1 Tax=Agrococcus casei TaxID=343512 RepID=UPI003F8D940A
MSSPDPLSLERQVCFALTVASRSVVAAYKPVLDPMGITHPQYLVMLALWAEEPLTVSELAERLHQDAPTLSPLLKRLETRGLVKRMRSTTDERRLQISLTDAGAALRSQAAEVPFEMAKRLGMEPGRLVELHEAMIELIEASQRSLEPKA